MKKCNACGAPEGSLHNRGCFNEVCPFCFGQLVSCMCVHLHFGYNPQPMAAQHPTMGLPKDVFENGLRAEQIDEWDGVVTEKGRISYFYFPLICTHCGEVDTGFFMVPDEDWQSVVPENHWKDIICRECFEGMKRLLIKNS